VSPSRPLARRAARGAGIAGVFLALVAVRVVLASSAELSEGDRFRAAGEPDAAVVHYRRAARWYVPGSPTVVAALDHIAAIARRAEREGDPERALGAYRAIRGAILSTRSFYTPHRDRLEAANRRIAALVAAQEPAPIDAAKSEEERRREHLALLSAPVGPSVPFTLLLLIGFFTWVVGAFRLASRGFDEEDRLVRAEALRWGGLAGGGFLLFVLGMAFA